MIGTVLALVALAQAYELRAGITPVQQVIKLMQEMKETGEKEMAGEAATFKEYAAFCKDTATEKRHAIETADATIERAEAAVEKHSVAADALGDEIAEIDGDIATWQADTKAATEVRDTARDDYETTHADYSESVDALDRAINTLRKGPGDVEQALLQVAGVAQRRSPEISKADLMALLAAPANPQADAFQSSSGGIIGMLEKLQKEFKAERSALETDEVKERQSFDMLALKLADNIKYGTKSRLAKQAAKGENEAAHAEAQGVLGATTAARADDQKYLEDLGTQCEAKGEAFANRQQLRKEEIAAIQKAIEIISSTSVKGSSDKHLPALVQSSFSLLRASATNQARVAQLLQGKAQKLQSRALALVAASASGGDPMEKVKKMIRDMVVKLQEEANAEAEHKGWCDTELGTNKQTREEKTSSVEELTAKKDQLSAKINRLSGDIQDASDAIAALDRAMKEGTEVRAKEKAKNEQTVKDAQAALEAIGQAQQVLKEFYEKAGDATSFAQGPAEDAPESFSKPYKGNTGASSGVLGMLEVIHSDFARLETDTTSGEAAAQSAFDSFSEESAVDRAAKEQERDHASKTRTAKEEELGQTTDDLAATQAELDAALDYFDKLKPSCVADGLSFEERTQRRQEEIESLQEAFKILGEDLA